MVTCGNGSGIGDDSIGLILSNIPGGVTDPIGPSSGIGRVQRGGGWFSRPQYVRVAEREYDPLGERDPRVGFRLARTAE